MNDANYTQILNAIRTALNTKLHYIGTEIKEESEKISEARKIRDTGNFIDNIDYEIENKYNSMTLYVGSRATYKDKSGNRISYEPYVLGGKVPSWTPIAPLKAWVERKNLAWLDKETGKALTVEQMAYMIRSKIKRKGIEPRNVFAEVLKNKQKWIFDQLNSVNLVLE